MPGWLKSVLIVFVLFILYTFCGAARIWNGTIKLKMMRGLGNVRTVRRHINWNSQRPDLREDLAHQVDNTKRRVCGIASAGSPWFSV